jgi:hypothetical protein
MYYSSPEESKRIIAILDQLHRSITTSQKKYFTLKEVENLLGLGRTQIYYLRKMGALASKQIGKKVYVSMDAINHYFNQDNNI